MPNNKTTETATELILGNTKASKLDVSQTNSKSTTTTPKSSTPILLNGKLGKRSRNSLVKNNIEHKKACYNLRDVAHSQKKRTALDIDIRNDVAKTNSKKILNYFMKKKPPQVSTPKSLYGIETKLFNERTATEAENSVICFNNKSESEKGLKQSTKTNTHDVQTNIIMSCQRSSTTYFDKNTNVSPLSLNMQSAKILTPYVNKCDLDNTKITATQIKPIGELKVKCLCRLRGSDTDEDISSVHKSDSELRDFFKLFANLKKWLKTENAVAFNYE
ncbi:uncharacterized protein LOC142234970 [Haematobia irritans]|uniref:uncharacterized protein LOC142234970 n=1 Tax=Haematobia irritans TaxID=7368 RepID=UPI003F503546